MKGYNKRKNKISHSYVIIFSLILVLALLYFRGGLIGLSILETSSQADFDSGAYYQTFYNTSGEFVQLNASQTTGNYTSKIFDAGQNSSWNNISWWRAVGFELPNYGENESYLIQGIDMTGNVLLMHMNEANGTIVDSSGQGNNGTTYGGVTYGANGKLNKALFFGNDGDVVESDSYNYTFGQKLTLAAWFKYSGAGTGSPRILEISKNGDANSHCLATDSDGSLRAWVECDTGSRVASVDDSNNYNDGKWHLMVYTYSNPNAMLYVDGIQTASITGGCTNLDDGRYLAIGAISNGSGAYTHAQHEFDGYIDEVSVWNRSLSAEEVLRMYREGILYLNLSVRSCDDDNCSGENWIDIDDTSYQNLSLENNRYFQFRYEFKTDNVSYSPKLYNVSINYNLLDNTPPVISSVEVENPVIKRSSVIIKANVTDNEEVGLVTAEIASPNGTFTNITLNEVSQNQYQESFRDTTVTGNYNVTIYAKDAAGNVDIERTNFTVQQAEWFNSLFRYRLPLLIEEKDNVNRVDFPFEISINFSYHNAKNNSIRIIDDNNLEIPYQIENAVYSGENYQSVEMVFPVNISANSSRIFYVYYSDTNITPANFLDFLSYSKSGEEHIFETGDIKVKLNDKYNDAYAGITEWYDDNSSLDLLKTDNTSASNTGLITWGDARDSLGLAPELMVNGSVYKKYKWKKSDGIVYLTFYRGTDYIKSEFNATAFANYFANGDENSILYGLLTLDFPDKVYIRNGSYNFSSGSDWHKSFNVTNFSEPWYYISNESEGFLFTFNHLSELQELFGAAYSNSIEAPTLEFNSLQDDFTFYISYVRGDNVTAREKYLEMTRPLDLTIYREEIPEDNEAPDIINVNVIPNKIELGAKIKINSEVEDNFEVTSVNSTIEYPNGTILSLNLTEESENVFAVNFTPSATGTYNIYMTASDGKGNMNDTRLNPSSLIVVDREEINSSWFNNSWEYRIPLVVGRENYTKINDLAEVRVNLSEVLKNNNIGGNIDYNSLRVINGTSEELPLKYNRSTAKLKWLMNGTISSGENKSYYLYFDTEKNGNKSAYKEISWLEDEYLVTGGSSGLIYYIRSKGNGSFDTQQFIEDVGSNVWGLGIGDFDNDGDYDVVAGNSLGEAKFLEHVSEDNFSGSVNIGHFSASNYGMDIAVADFNNDGKLDFVISGNNDDYTLFLGEGNGSFINVSITTDGPESRGRGKDAADFDSDGCMDFVSGTNTQSVYYWKGLCNGSFLAPVVAETIPYVHQYGVAAADFDNDGNIDLLVDGYSLGIWWFIKGNGDGTFQEEIEILNRTNYWNSGDNFDFNHDGNEDLVMVDYDNRYAYYYEGTGNGSLINNITIGTPIGAGRMGISAPTLERLPNITVQSLEVLPELNLSYNYNPSHPLRTDTITFIVNSTSSNKIRKCEISIDNSDYGLMNSIDGSYDETKEDGKYQTKLTSGTHNISERCTDSEGIFGFVDFNVTVSSTKVSVCGNGIRESNEECDNSDGVPSGYICNNQCELEAQQEGGTGGAGGASETGRSSGGGGTASSGKIKKLPREEFVSKNYASRTIKKLIANTPTEIKFNTIIDSIELNVKKSKENVVFKIEDITERPNAIPSAGKVYRYIKINIENLSDEEVDDSIIRFKIDKDWLNENNYDEGKVVLKRLSGGKWHKLETAKVSEDNSYVYFESHSPGFSYFAISIEPSEKMEEGNANISVIAILLFLILGIIVLLILIFLKKKKPKRKKKFHHKIKKKIEEEKSDLEKELEHQRGEA